LCGLSDTARLSLGFQIYVVPESSRELWLISLVDTLSSRWVESSDAHLTCFDPLFSF